MKRKNTVSENYLEKIPKRNIMNFSVDEKKIITLEIENRGFANKIAQKILKKPKISYIHLDKFGSFVWSKIDGEKSIIDIGKDVEKEFGDEANPLYERLAKYFEILKSYDFVSFK